jgi:hypothetical protein
LYTCLLSLPTGQPNGSVDKVHAKGLPAMPCQIDDIGAGAAAQVSARPAVCASRPSMV